MVTSSGVYFQVTECYAQRRAKATLFFRAREEYQIHFATENAHVAGWKNKETGEQEERKKWFAFWILPLLWINFPATSATFLVWKEESGPLLLKEDWNSLVEDQE